MGRTLQLLNAATAAGVPAAVKATGTITTIAAASLVDGETFTISDGLGSVRVFELDTNGVVSVGIRVDISGGLTADQVRDAIIAVVNADAGLAVTASNGGAATVTLTNDFPGKQGNLLLAETVANAGFIVSGMSGGSIGGFAIQAFLRKLEGTPDETALVLKSTAGSGAMTASVRLWVYSDGAQEFVPLLLAVVATDTNRGLLDAGALVGEFAAPADRLLYAEIVRGLQHFSYAAAEIVGALGGASTAVGVWLEVGV